MINSVNLTGRLTNDVELRYTQNGSAVASFNLAVSRQFTNAQGKRDTDFIQCVAWRKSAETLANYTHKGSLIGITGRLSTRNYEKDGKTVYVTEVNVDSFSFLEPKDKATKSDPFEQTTQKQEWSPSALETPEEPVTIDDDSLPF